ncbi:TfoX/Sxy family protein [Thermostichus vulcanus]|uniref:TfoX/Sxy family protein n=1 Tax=Thermostichus vulcanus str. 'Rupite' TaxID=2813851 RepID=A0ABT0CBL2_THEVL|nr:TfoX/Sxy family protein [Thermostichus vulcanus]MCJ2543183.1 TfoX/Sxy family protein [Thermostichus vulcanus str. 'Rupite']
MSFSLSYSRMMSEGSRTPGQLHPGGTINDFTPLKGLKNIVPTIAQQLAEVGIVTVRDLKSVGVVNTYKRLKAQNPAITIPICYYLYALQGALEGVHWDDLSPEVARLWAETSLTNLNGDP